MLEVSGDIYQLGQPSWQTPACYHMSGGILASFPGSPGTRICITPCLHNFNVRILEHGSLGMRLGIYVVNNKGSHFHGDQQHYHEIWEWEVCLRNKGWGI